MRCPICRFGETAPGTKALTLEEGNSVVVLKGVPGEICEACGEGYFNDEVVDTVSAIADWAAANGPEVQRLSYPKAKQAIDRSQRKVA